jgi:hypothetical protein
MPLTQAMAVTEARVITVHLPDERIHERRSSSENFLSPDTEIKNPDPPKHSPPLPPTHGSVESKTSKPSGDGSDLEDVTGSVDTQVNYETAGKTNALRKGKGPMTAPTGEPDETTWMRHPPPAALSSACDGLSDDVLDIVKSSIENISAKAAEFENQRHEEEEARQQAADTEKETVKGKGKEKEIDYLPIIIPETEEVKRRRREDELAKRRQAALTPNTGFVANGIPRQGHRSNTSDPSQRGNKRHRYNLSRILNRLGGGDRGESSTAGPDGDIRERSAGNSEPATMATSLGRFESPDSISSEALLDRATGLKQLGIVATLLQKSHRNSTSRLSVVGSVRRRTKGGTKTVLVEKEAGHEGADVDAAHPNNNGDESEGGGVDFGTEHE